MTDAVAPRPGGAARRRRLARSALVALSALAGFTVVELYVRAEHGAPLPERLPILEVQANRHRGWEMVPGDVHYTYLHPVHVNSLGLRGPELPEKQDGERRILCLGDSLTYGQGVADEATIPAYLEELLTTPDRPVTVVNGGLRAYATHQELALLRELGPTVAPDEVLLLWYWNDLEERDITRTYAKLSASGPIAFDVGDPLGAWQRFLWRARQPIRRSAVLNLLHERFAPREWSNWDDGFVEEGFTKLEGYLDGFRETCAELDASFRIVLMPDPTGLDGASLSGRLTERALELFEQEGIERLDLRPTLGAWMAEHGRAPILPHDGHFDAEGNRVLAEAIAGFVTTSGG